MANIYIHLSANDINAAMLEASGLKLPEEEQEKPRVLKCPRCKEIIDKKAQFCFRCGLPSTIESSETIETEKTVISELVLQLQKADPAILNALINAVKSSNV